jgi:hypothetical protein
MKSVKTNIENAQACAHRIARINALTGTRMAIDVAAQRFGSAARLCRVRLHVFVRRHLYYHY